MVCFHLLRRLTFVAGGCALGLVTYEREEQGDQRHWENIPSGLLRSINWGKLSLACSLVFCESKTDDNFNDNGLLEWKSGREQKDLKASIVDREKILLLLHQVKEKFGIPGLVCAVSIDGKVCLMEALGFADVENGSKCTEDMVTRLASISKAFTSIGVAKLLQEGKLDLDAPVQHYVPFFPKKEIDGKPVEVTLRHLLSHTSGIRHYTPNTKRNDKDKEMKEEKKDKKKKTRELEKPEYYIQEHYADVTSALALFSQDKLHFVPGTDYLYSTFAFTLVSAILEKASGKKFTEFMAEISKDLNLRTLMPEFHQEIVSHRARTYRRNGEGQLENTPFVDNSYKWAGGGFLGSVHDLLKLGHGLLYAYQGDHPSSLASYISSVVMQQLWTPVEVTVGKVSKKFPDVGYGLGWCVRPRKELVFGTISVPMTAYHTGAAIGASSILMLIPTDPLATDLGQVPSDLPQRSGLHSPRGIVIAIIANLEDASLSETAFCIAQHVMSK